MAVFACALCDAVLTNPVSRIALPVHTQLRYQHTLLPPLMDPGTYAVDPEPSGPPWRRWHEIGDDAAAARGVFAPTHALSCGEPGAIILAPGDTRGMVLIPDRLGGDCMGLAGNDGPNLACERCGQPVATRIDDCEYWQEARLTPSAVRQLPIAGPADRPTGWTELVAASEPFPPIDLSGQCDLRWEAATGMTLALLLAASGGAPVTVPDGLLADLFRRPLDALLPPGPPAKRATLAGPGLPTSNADIALVPRHPQTGEPWQPQNTAIPVPLAIEVWLHIAFHPERRPIPVSGGLPDGVLRDDPLPPHPSGPTHPDLDVFRHTLARLPAVREPWLRRIYEPMREQPYSLPF
ncbi:hypothetical protein [Crossiella cryophila]|uniref:Uncharacterized protein n=1 Tax=Crossiella cryophila TaxID=43355 RepID=A0A7W7FWK9_9PSEU|nr:hypothetical protein [Crossiella cryophila]MBB4680165.1 hypothetical protein [Crossiella cryophila]